MPTNEPIRGISVICAADAPEAGSGAVESDRGQVLDGIVRYDNDLVIVMESKLGDLANDRQAREINLHGQPVRFDGEVRSISWRAILSAFDDLANEKRAVTAGAERIILRDFLEFADRNFPRLGPFSTLQRCTGEPSRVMRRLRAILKEATSGEADGENGIILPGRHLAVISAYLGMEKQEVHLRMYPADTLEQARFFYAQPKAPERVLALKSKGWRVSPNFHFGFMAKGLSWTKVTASVDDYIRYWQKHIGETRQVDQADWTMFWDQLIKLGFAEEANLEHFKRDFTLTKRKSAIPRPGILCHFVWPFEEAEHLDTEKKFGAAIKERVNELLVAAGEPAV